MMRSTFGLFKYSMKKKKTCQASTPEQSVLYSWLYCRYRSPEQVIKSDSEKLWFRVHLDRLSEIYSIRLTRRTTSK